MVKRCRSLSKAGIGLLEDRAGYAPGPHKTNRVSNPQRPIPIRRNVQSDSFNPRSLPSLTTYASMQAPFVDNQSSAYRTVWL